MFDLGIATSQQPLERIQSTHAYAQASYIALTTAREKFDPVIRGRTQFHARANDSEVVSSVPRPSQ